jgi:hypothetical protein
MFIPSSITVPTLAIIAVVHCTANGDDRKPAVSLLLSKASAERSKRYVLFRCDAVIDNATGKDLTVRSNFNSVFDGLELVVTTPDGEVLAQQGYTYHQSPVSLGKSFTLKQGRTERALVFPIGEISSEAKTLKVRLVGTLPGSDY